MVDENSWQGDESICYLAGDIFYSKRDQVYWFADEAEQLNGPYNTQEEAEQALKTYFGVLHRPKQPQ